MAIIITVLVFTFVFGALLFRTWPNVSKKPSLLAMLIAIAAISLMSIGFYMQFFSNAEEQAWLKTRETLLPEIQSLLETGEASKVIKNLDGKTFIGAMTYYAQRYPQESRVWQKLAVVMVSLGMPEESLKAVRRYLKLEPQDRQGQQLQLQLLAQLIDEKKASPAQLRLALQQFIQRTDLLPEDRLQIAGLAQKYEFFDEAAAILKQILADDQRTDDQLSHRALDGRRLMIGMIESYQQQAQSGPLESKAVEQNLAAQDSTTLEAKPNPVDVEEFRVAVQLKLSDDARRTLQIYKDKAGSDQVHVWVSVVSSQPGPPIAAKLVWLSIDSLLASPDNFEIVLKASDLVLTQGWQKHQDLISRAILVLSDVQSDPIAAKASPIQGTVDLDMAAKPRQAIVTLDVLSKSGP